MTKYLPALLVALTALVTTLLVHAAFTVWWAVEAFGKANRPPFDWTNALIVSGVATTVVLVAGLLAHRLAGGNKPEIVREPRRPSKRPAADATVIVTSRRRPTSA